MFITLKARSRRGGESGMQQVSSRDAGPGITNGSRSAASSSSKWRPPCMACQTKRVSEGFVDY
jgi:hypothetical protein